jgi:hypothetical protein
VKIIWLGLSLEKWRGEIALSVALEIRVDEEEDRLWARRLLLQIRELPFFRGSSGLTSWSLRLMLLGFCCQ